MAKTREYYREWEKKHKEHRKEYRKAYNTRPGVLARASEQNRWRNFREVFRKYGYKVPEYFPREGPRAAGSEWPDRLASDRREVAIPLSMERK